MPTSLCEKEILRMVASGYTSTEIGARLFISGMTVNTPPAQHLPQTAGAQPRAGRALCFAARLVLGQSPSHVGTRPALFATVCSGCGGQIGLDGRDRREMVGALDADQGAAAWCGAARRAPPWCWAHCCLRLPRERAGAPALPPVPVPSCKPSASALRVTCTTSWAHSSSTRWRCCTARTPPDREAQAALEQGMLHLRFVVDSMDAQDEPVTTRLARLRHRLQPVLERRGIQPAWEMDPPAASPRA